MKAALTIILLISSMFSVPDSSNVEGWRGIVPLHSTRSDVERLLGPMTHPCECGYYLDDVNVFFKYSPGDCKSGRGKWNVPRDTVLGIIVYPKTQPQLSDLKLDMSKFSKEYDGHVESIVSYVNDEEGLTIEVDEDTRSVNGYYYGPAKKDKLLRCP